MTKVFLSESYVPGVPGISSCRQADPTKAKKTQEDREVTWLKFQLVLKLGLELITNISAFSYNIKMYFKSK